MFINPTNALFLFFLHIQMGGFKTVLAVASGLIGVGVLLSKYLTQRMDAIYNVGPSPVVKKKGKCLDMTLSFLILYREHVVRCGPVRSSLSDTEFLNYYFTNAMQKSCPALRVLYWSVRKDLRHPDCTVVQIGMTSDDSDSY
jgi:hypothetical protein